MSQFFFQIDGHGYVVECSGHHAHGHCRIVADGIFEVCDTFGYANIEDDIYDNYFQAHTLRGAAKISFINKKMREAVLHEVAQHAEYCLQMIEDGLIDPKTGLDIIDQDENEPVITAVLVSDDERLDFLPSFLGPELMIRGENLVFSMLEALSPDYDGGFWDFYRLSNGGFFMAPDMDQRLRIQVPGNGYAGEMSAAAAGVVVTLFALNALAEHEFLNDCGSDRMSRLYHALRDFALGHQEASAIIGAID